MSQGDKERKFITRDEIKDAISRSGYLIEQRVAQSLSSNDYYVGLNLTFTDPNTGKTREIDIKADSAYKSPLNEHGFATGIQWSIVCECENNLQPIVFFPYQTEEPATRCRVIKCFGVPMKIWKNGEYTDLRLYLPIQEFHHYCQNEIATQYCTFIKPKQSGSDWIALHDEQQHDTFNSLIYSIDDEINDFYTVWELPEHDEEEPIFLEFRYPLIVLGGELLEANLGRHQLNLKKSKHIKYLKTANLKGMEEDYLIDVITEDYLKEYLELIQKEMHKIRILINRRSKTINQSIIKTVQDSRVAKQNNENYRRLLTLEKRPIPLTEQ